MHFIKFTLIFVLGICTGLALRAQTTHVLNPIMAGFYPDPSVLRVGDDYYLVNSTFAYFPGIPVFHSKDLKNWKQLTSAIDRPTQMNFMGDRVTRGLFAPAINYHKGMYYITCTLIDHKGNFVVTAKDPAGPWSDPIWLDDVKGIDPSLFFDGDKAYVVYNSDPPDNKSLYSGHRTIKMYQLNIANMKLIGEPTIIVNGGVDISKKPVWIEGPHIMKVKDWYYLYAAEGGTSVNHSEVVFRSKSATGPYVPYEHNPILTQRDLPENRNDPITSAGHAQFVNGPDGKTYAVFLAVRPYEGDYYNTGRETFIAPVKWIDGWPVVSPDKKEIQYSYNFGYKEVKQKDALPQSGNFSYKINFKGRLNPSLLFLRTYDPSWFKTDAKNGLTLNLKPETVAGTGNPAFIGKRQQHLNCTVGTQLQFTANNAKEKAGMTIFQSETHFYNLCKSVDNGKPVIQLFKSTDQPNELNLLAQETLAGNKPVFLQIKAKGDQYEFYYGEKEGEWKLLKGGVDAHFLSTHTAGGFVGCLFAMYATSSGEASANTASYKYLTYAGDDPVYHNLK